MDDSKRKSKTNNDIFIGEGGLGLEKETSISFPFQQQKIKICCLTWNMHGLEPTDEQVQELLDPHKGFDIYCIGSEECLRSIFKSFFYQDKSMWEIKLQNYFGKDYRLLSSVTLCAIHLVIFYKEKYSYYLSDVKTNYVKTGGGNLFGNKGAVGVGFKLFGISFMVINCHLAALFNKSEQRNLDYKRCIENMNKNYNSIDFIVFMGDLNYRLNNLNISLEKIKNDYLSFLAYDQFITEINSNRLDLLGFKEGEIKFQPTFKYWNNTNNYQFFDTKNIDQAPAWCDRILYKKNTTNKNIIDVIQNKYDSMQEIIMSDHKPLYSYFTLMYN